MAEERYPAPATQACDEEQLAGIVHGLVAEVHPGGAGLPVRLDSRLDADLGLDSLAVVELRSRMEEAFGVVLPERILVVGTGAHGRMRPAAGLEENLAARGVTIEVLPTSAAVDRINELFRLGATRWAGTLHLTC